MIRKQALVSLKIKILSPLLVMFAFFAVLSVGSTLMLADRYRSLRDRLNDVASVQSKTVQIASLTSRAQESLLKFGLSKNPNELTKIVDLHLQRASLVDQVYQASTHADQRLHYLRAYVRSLDRLRALQSSLTCESVAHLGARRAELSTEWKMLESVSGARLTDLVNFLGNETREAQRGIESFLSIVLVLTLGALAICMLCIWATALYYQRTLIFPLARLREGLRSVLQGDLVTEIPVPDTRDEIREMSADFNLMTKTLQESQSELRAFVSIAAHDLRSPLATIRSFCDVLEEDVDEGNYVEARSNISRVASISQRSIELMDQLLKFERAGQAKIELEPVDLGEIVKDAVESLGSVIRSTGAVIETSALGKILGDATQLRALFQNLISNAIKFRREGVTPQVRIESSIAVDETGRWQEVRVIDNGRGFGPEVPSLMFKPFCRFKSSSGTEGFGVGLSTCRKIVMRHQGLIKAEGQLNEGATFFIRFPLASR